MTSDDVKTTAKVLNGNYPRVKTIGDLFDLLKTPISERLDFIAFCLIKQARDYNDLCKKSENLQKPL